MPRAATEPLRPYPASETVAENRPTPAKATAPCRIEPWRGRVPRTSRTQAWRSQGRGKKQRSEELGGQKASSFPEIPTGILIFPGRPAPPIATTERDVSLPGTAVAERRLLRPANRRGTSGSAGAGREKPGMIPALNQTENIIKKKVKLTQIEGSFLIRLRPLRFRGALQRAQRELGALLLGVFRRRGARKSRRHLLKDGRSRLREVFGEARRGFDGFVHRAVRQAIAGLAERQERGPRGSGGGVFGGTGFFAEGGRQGAAVGFAFLFHQFVKQIDGSPAAL